MSEPIIIRTPAPDTEERLVLVPPDAVSRTVGGDELLTIRTANARDATPADLERAGYVTGEMLAEHVRIVWAAGQEAEPVGVAMLRRLKDRAEKAERERDDLLGRISDAEEAARCRGRERDTLRAEVARLTAPGEGEPTEDALISAWDRFDGFGPEGVARFALEQWRLGVAHERARQQPAKDRATEGEAALFEASDEAVDADLRAAGVDPEALAARGLAFVRECQRQGAKDEELVDLYRKVYETHGGRTIDVSHDDCRRAAVGAVAARVRQECLVAQAVGMGAGVTISRMSERVPGTTGMWDVYVTRRPDVPGEHYAYGVPTADVPATLARLLGEVARG